MVSTQILNISDFSFTRNITDFADPMMLDFSTPRKGDSTGTIERTIKYPWKIHSLDITGNWKVLSLCVLIYLIFCLFKQFSTWGLEFCNLFILGPRLWRRGFKVSLHAFRKVLNPGMITSSSRCQETQGKAGRGLGHGMKWLTCFQLINNSVLTFAMRNGCWYFRGVEGNFP